LLGFGHRTAEYHVVHFGRIDARSTTDGFGNGGSRELVRARAAQRAVRGFADGRANSGNDDGVVHGQPDQSPSKSSIASATSPTLPSNRWSAASMTTSSFGSAARA